MKHLVDAPLDRQQIIAPPLALLPAFFSESEVSISAVNALTETDAILRK